MDDAVLVNLISEASALTERANKICADLELGIMFSLLISPTTTDTSSSDKQEQQQSVNNLFIRVTYPFHNNYTLFWPWMKFQVRMIDIEQIHESWMLSLKTKQQEQQEQQQEKPEKQTEENDKKIEKTSDENDTATVTGKNNNIKKSDVSTNEDANNNNKTEAVVVEKDVATFPLSILDKMDYSENPFTDCDEHDFVGDGRVWLQPLSNMIETQLDTRMLSPHGDTAGKVFVDIQPLDNKHGKPGPWDEKDGADLDPFVDDPASLVGKKVKFGIKVGRFFEANQEYRDLFVRYQLIPGETEFFHTSEVSTNTGGEAKFDADEMKVFHFDPATAELVEHFKKGWMFVQVFGKVPGKLRLRPAGEEGGDENEDESGLVEEDKPASMSME